MSDGRGGRKPRALANVNQVSPGFFRTLGIHRMLLHAERLAFPHPDGGRLEVAAPVDAAFARALKLFDAQAPIPHD